MRRSNPTRSLVLLLWCLLVVFIPVSAADRVGSSTAQEDEDLHPSQVSGSSVDGVGSSSTESKEEEEEKQLHPPTRSSSSYGPDSCDEDDQCPEELSCEFGRCVAKKCMMRELKDLQDSFDAQQYKQALLKEAGITDRDLVEARVQNPDPKDFAQAAAVVAFKETIQAHSHELLTVVDIINQCNNGEADRRLAEAAIESKDKKGIGTWAGSLFHTVTSLFQTNCAGNSPTGTPSAAPSAEPSSPPSSVQPSVSSRPSLAPSISIAPSTVPSSSPSFSISQKVFLGFHLEGGIVFDGSCSFLFPQNTASSQPGDTDEYFRGCLGAGIGGGFETSLIIMVAQLRENNDVTGVSLLSEFFEFGFGPHIGFGIGFFTEGVGASNDNDAIHYEVTLGGGLGIGIVEASICQTLETGA